MVLGCLEPVRPQNQASPGTFRDALNRKGQTPGSPAHFPNPYRFSSSGVQPLATLRSTRG